MVRTSRRRGWRRGLVAAVVVVLSAAALTACGSSGDSSASGDSGSTTSSSSDVKYFQDQVTKLYKGTFATPSGPTVKAPTGKHIWVDSAGQAISASVLTTAAIKAAAQKLGWQVTVYDSKFDPTRMLTGVQQALAAKADGIILLYVDCPLVKTALQQAKKAGVPSMGIEIQDCQPSLTHVTGYAGKHTFDQFVKLYGEAQVDWVVAKTNGKAKTIVDAETDSHTTRAVFEGVKGEFAKCSTCQMVDVVKWVGTDLGPKLQSKVQQALIKHPDANSYITAYDAAMTQGGIAAALRSAGRLHNMQIMGGEGSAAGIEEIKNGTGMQACVGEDVRMEGYGAVDGLVRLFLKRNPDEVDTGIGFQLCDKDHNLPPAGQPFQPPVDYPAAFYKLWGVG
jgi:ribose transport system substrate-binding protein